MSSHRRPVKLHTLTSVRAISMPRIMQPTKTRANATVAAIRVELAPGSGQQATAAPPPEQAERSPLPVPVAADPAVAADGTVGSVLVESRPPGARVVIDGEPAGTTPIVVTDLPPGRREVRIERDGYTPWVTVVEVPALDRLRVAASLDRARP